MTESQQLSRIFKVLSVDTRIRIIQLLRDRVLCVNALARMLDVSPAAVSQHLRVLRDADLVTAARRGYFIHYGLNLETLARWKQVAERFLSLEVGQRST